MISEPAPILRRINPGAADGVESPPSELEAAWEKAVESIVEEHNDEVAKGDSQSVGPIQRWALKLLADHTVAIPHGGGEAFEALQVGRGQPVRRALGRVKRLLEAGELTRSGAARRIVEVVRIFGLRKVKRSEAKAETTPANVGVVCWLKVQKTQP